MAASHGDSEGHDLGRRRKKTSVGNDLLSADVSLKARRLQRPPIRGGSWIWRQRWCTGKG